MKPINQNIVTLIYFNTGYANISCSTMTNRNPLESDKKITIKTIKVHNNNN